MNFYYRLIWSCKQSSQVVTFVFYEPEVQCLGFSLSECVCVCVCVYAMWIMQFQDGRKAFSWTRHLLPKISPHNPAFINTGLCALLTSMEGIWICGWRVYGLVSGLHRTSWQSLVDSSGVAHRRFICQGLAQKYPFLVKVVPV